MHQYLTRPQAAEYLQSLGAPVASNTLRKFVVTGGGPRTHRFGRRVLYRPCDLDAWVTDRLEVVNEGAPVGDLNSTGAKEN